MGIIELYRKEEKKFRKAKKRVKVVKSVYKNRKKLGDAVYSVMYLLLTMKKKS